jgi:murein L,D-transpeptidase YafK
MAINYPNLSDRRKSCASHLGDNICIHGSCATIGCLPRTDDFIKEIYLLGAQAKNNGQERIPVYIFPFIMDDSNMAKYSEIFSSNDLLLAFWNNLKVGYDKFEVDLKELKITVDSKGDYQFN